MMVPRPETINRNFRPCLFIYVGPLTGNSTRPKSTHWLDTSMNWADVLLNAVGHVSEGGNGRESRIGAKHLM